MSRDGLLPKAFSRIHPKFHTPAFATIVTGFVVAIPALFMNLTEVTDLTSIGTLFAFVLVCGGVLLLPREAAQAGKFHLPYVNGKIIIPLITIIILGACIYFKPAPQVEMMQFKKLKERSAIIDNLNAQDNTVLLTSFNTIFGEQHIAPANATKYFKDIEEDKFNTAIRAANISDAKKYYLGLDGFLYNFPNYLFFILIIIISFYSFTKNFSLIPVLGLMSCFYLMTELGYTNWLRFLIWLVIGLVIYFTYSYKNSVLGREAKTA
jgi:amino acid transporter